MADIDIKLATLRIILPAVLKPYPQEFSFHVSSALKVPPKPDKDIESTSEILRKPVVLHNWGCLSPALSLSLSDDVVILHAPRFNVDQDSSPARDQPTQDIFRVVANKISRIWCTIGRTTGVPVKT